MWWFDALQAVNLCVDFIRNLHTNVCLKRTFVALWRTVFYACVKKTWPAFYARHVCACFGAFM